MRRSTSGSEEADPAFPGWWPETSAAGDQIIAAAHPPVYPMST